MTGREVIRETSSDIDSVRLTVATWRNVMSRI